MSKPRIMWQVRWPDPVGGYKRKHFSDEGKAQAYAKEKIAEISREGVQGALFGAEARAEYATARQLLDPLGVSLLEVVRDYAKRNMPSERKELDAGLVDYLGAKERANRAERTMSTIDKQVTLMAKQCGWKYVDDIDPQHVEHFLSSPTLGPVTRKNYRTSLNGFCEYAIKRGWLKVNPIRQVEIPIIDGVDVQTLHPWHVFWLMRAVERIEGGRIARAVAVRLFGGLRPSEADALREQDIAQDVIRVGKGKLRGRRAVRIVPISENLRAWLDAYRDKPLQPEGYRKCIEEARRQAGNPDWKQDIMRKTWISFRMALVQDERQVSREAGNSPDVIYRHYYQLRSPKEARVFFGVRPRQG